MVNQDTKLKPKTDETFHLRKLTKAGGSRYLSVGALLPKEWEAVKVYLNPVNQDVIDLRLVRIS